MASSSAPSNLRLFPTIDPPRKPSLKKPKPTEAPGELKGVAIQVETSSALGVIQPANNHIKHSLFCEPSTSRSNSLNRGPNGRRQRLSTGAKLTSASSPLEADGEDQLAPLPENPHFRTTPMPANGQSPQFNNPPKLTGLCTAVPRDTETLASPGGDGLSPLPDIQTFAAASASPSEYPPPRSLRSGSPTLVRSNSAATAAPAYSPAPPAARSIFPQYDPTKPLSHQHYYPNTMRTATPTLPREKVNKHSPVEKKKCFDQWDQPAATVVNGYEHIPVADGDDLLAVWNASCGNFPVSGRKVQFKLVQPRGQGTSLSVGTTEDDLLYTMEKDLSASVVPDSETVKSPSKQLIIKKPSPLEKPLSAPVAQLSLPEASASKEQDKKELITIFPQMAAISAIETVANSAAASAIATFDPTAASPEAAQLAQDAVSEAHRRYRCELVRTTRKRDSLGAVTATYKLEHPLLGSFPITVTKSTCPTKRDARAKISIHHPSATPAAISAETLSLAFLDFARDACVLDTPGLLALEGPHIIDTVICALLAVAVIENDALLVAETQSMIFEAPPTVPFSSKQTSSRTNSSIRSKRSSKKWYKRSSNKVEEMTPAPEEVELPLVTQGALALLGLSFKTAIWVLEAGVKVTAGVVIGVTHLAQKA